MKYLVLLGRLLYSAIFISAGFGHFSQQGVDYAVQRGLPMASFLVPLAGIMIILGGFSIALGYRGRWGAWLIVVFLVIVGPSMHRFWTYTDPVLRFYEMGMFMKDLSLLGAALLITYFGTGPLSLKK